MSHARSKEVIKKYGNILKRHRNQLEGAPLAKPGTFEQQRKYK